MFEKVTKLQKIEDTKSYAKILTNGGRNGAGAVRAIR